MIFAARQLLEVEGVETADALTEAHYHHLFRDEHEVIIANSTVTGSFYRGPQVFRTRS
ncbi:Hint domain-containing protein [Paracoccus seriniphilus]|uniref:Hint domain-containing protein n=1 Tax=Paracoccus seriniphilus TaxID=184748 RepID=UPI000B79159D|nr:Hint domain-containing protein [Paracoccus seriniphilus]